MVPIQIPEELIEESRIVLVGLIINYVLGPMIKKLDDHYERPLSCYKFPVLLLNSGFFMKSIIHLLL